MYFIVIWALYMQLCPNIYNRLVQMDFIAMKCNLGIAIKQALEEIVFD